MIEQYYSLEVLGSPIEIIIHDTGEGVDVLIAGGERPHIGAVSVKRPGEDLITHEFPSHRDSAVSDRWACVLSERLNKTVIVSAGIHYDNINKAQIEEILISLDTLLDTITEATE